MLRSFVIYVSVQILKFSKEDIENIRKVLAAILHLGNVEFTGPKDGHFSRVPNQKQVSCVSVNECKYNYMYVHLCV